MTEETTVIHNRIPVELDNFIEELSKEPEFYNKTHVVIYAIQRLKDEVKGSTSDTKHRDKNGRVVSH